MYCDVWDKNFASVCSISFYGSNGAKIHALTGFKIKDHIVTDDHIYNLQDAKEVKIVFYKEDGVSKKFVIQSTVREFLNNLPRKGDFDMLGFSLIPATQPELNTIPSLSLCRSCNNLIGKSVCSIGYQSENNNLSLKTGIISSYTTDDKGNSYIQFDGTVKSGNSGAPLIKHGTGNVVGIIRIKVQGVVQSLNEIVSIIDANLEVLKGAEGKFTLNDIDLFQVLIANQTQIKHLNKELLKNITEKSGYALDIGHLSDFLESKTETEFDQFNISESG